jgi:hypothetical protein
MQSPSSPIPQAPGFTTPASAPPYYPYSGPSQNSEHPLQDTTGYQPISPIHDRGSYSQDFSPRQSDSYITRPPPAMAPPHYLQEVRYEAQGGGEMGEYQGGYSRSKRNEEEELYKTAGQFNPERNNTKSSKVDNDRSKEGFFCLTECCACFCFCCPILSQA